MESLTREGFHTAAYDEQPGHALPSRYLFRVYFKHVVIVIVVAMTVVVVVMLIVVVVVVIIKSLASWQSGHSGICPS